MDGWPGEIPMPLRERLVEILDLTDNFCDRYLNDEYKAVCRHLATTFCKENDAIGRGKPESWASGVVSAVGWVNFLTDPENPPSLQSSDIATGFGVSVGTMQGKARTIRETLDLIQLEPQFCLASLIDKNPLVWLIKVNGVIVDLRSAPRELQEAALRQGLIPYIPDDQEPRDDYLVGE